MHARADTGTGTGIDTDTGTDTDTDTDTGTGTYTHGENLPRKELELVQSLLEHVLHLRSEHLRIL